MADISVADGTLRLTMSAIERLESLHGDLAFPLASVESVEVVEHPLDVAHGFRLGTGVPGTMVIGSITGGGVKSFAVVHSETERGIVVRLDGQGFDQIIIGTAEPEDLASRITAPRS